MCNWKQIQHTVEYAKNQAFLLSLRKF